MSSISVKNGGKVKAGQEVGKQGNTGHSAGSHLHFEVRTNGKASGYGFGSNTEPIAYLQKHIGEEDEKMKEDLAAALKRIDVLELRANGLEEKTKALDKTAPPKWFTNEFGLHALDGIVSDMTGDADFWRDTAVSLGLKKK